VQNRYIANIALDCRNIIPVENITHVQKFKGCAKLELVFDDVAYAKTDAGANGDDVDDVDEDNLHKKPVNYVVEFEGGVHSRDDFCDLLVTLARRREIWQLFQAGGEEVDDPDNPGHKIMVNREGKRVKSLGEDEEDEEDTEGSEAHTLTNFLGSWLTRPVPDDKAGKTILDVVVWGGHDLLAMDTLTRSSDPFVDLELVTAGATLSPKEMKSLHWHNKYKTRVIPNSLEPHWNEKCSFVVSDRNKDELEIKVWDSDWMKHNDSLGVVTIKVSDLPLNHIETANFVLRTKSKENAGLLHISLHLKDYSELPVDGEEGGEGGESKNSGSSLKRGGHLGATPQLGFDTAGEKELGGVAENESKGGGGGRGRMEGEGRVLFAAKEGDVLETKGESTQYESKVESKGSGMGGLSLEGHDANVVTRMQATQRMKQAQRLHKEQGAAVLPFDDEEEVHVQVEAHEAASHESQARQGRAILGQARAALAAAGSTIPEKSVAPYLIQISPNTLHLMGAKDEAGAMQILEHIADIHHGETSAETGVVSFFFADRDDYDTVKNEIRRSMKEQTVNHRVRECPDPFCVKERSEIEAKAAQGVESKGGKGGGAAGGAGGSGDERWLHPTFRPGTRWEAESPRIEELVGEVGLKGGRGKNGAIAREEGV
jgi:hypothetical protein